MEGRGSSVQGQYEREVGLRFFLLHANDKIHNDLFRPWSMELKFLCERKKVYCVPELLVFDVHPFISTLGASISRQIRSWEITWRKETAGRSWKIKILEKSALLLFPCTSLHYNLCGPFLCFLLTGVDLRNISRFRCRQMAFSNSYPGDLPAAARPPDRLLT